MCVCAFDDIMDGGHLIYEGISQILLFQLISLLNSALKTVNASIRHQGCNPKVAYVQLQSTGSELHFVPKVNTNIGTRACAGGCTYSLE